MKSPISFFKPDDPLAGESLARSLEGTEQPILGLIVKVKKEENGDEQIVNWSFADPTLVKSLAALCLPDPNASNGETASKPAGSSSSRPK